MCSMPVFVHLALLIILEHVLHDGSVDHLVYVGLWDKWGTVLLSCLLLPVSKERAMLFVMDHQPCEETISVQPHLLLGLVDSSSLLLPMIPPAPAMVQHAEVQEEKVKGCTKVNMGEREGKERHGEVLGFTGKHAVKKQLVLNDILGQHMK
ncbi:hypothetical protein DAEQUDRAFT_739758 [Daedalea quercina L-15889]|uniref:Uncharacterized protein n=1 Tax=Daedalea quercina L-15889 TaxID=1314783 RepID=A0A165NEL3_9APHY|nr:hypothetical protein DAEQUDRAFT_739758 [Daedalea quercina L-15889]